MKALTITTGVLFFATLASGKCSMVEVLSVEPSFQHVRILTLYNGRPLDNVKLEVFSEGEQPRLSTSTNKEGVAKFSLSPPARYRIAAHAANGLGADLILDVSKGKGKNQSAFTLSLAVRPPPPPTLEDRIAAVENTLGERLREFEGVVVDVAGAVVPQTKVEVFKKGSRGKALAAETASDAEGHFSLRLPEGAYTAIFSRAGFSTKILVFELMQTAEGAQTNSLRVPLAIAPCS
jgi:hypothetical protein